MKPPFAVWFNNLSREWGREKPLPRGIRFESEAVREWTPFLCTDHAPECDSCRRKIGRDS